MHEIPFNVKAPEAVADTAADGGSTSSTAASSNKCPIPIQKETPAGLVDTICQNDVERDHAGMCR